MTWPGLALADSPLTTPHHTENIPENLSTHIYIYIYICVLADNPLTTPHHTENIPENISTHIYKWHAGPGSYTSCFE